MVKFYYINNSRGYSYLFKELDLNAAGFPGAIGFRKESSSESFSFVLWASVPQGKNDIMEPQPILTVTARAESAGVWAYGSGQRMIETCRAEFPLSGITLGRPAPRLIPSILERASELADTVQFEEFWEKERNPQLSYDKPPR